MSAAENIDPTDDWLTAREIATVLGTTPDDVAAVIGTIGLTESRDHSAPTVVGRVYSPAAMRLVAHEVKVRSR